MVDKNTKLQEVLDRIIGDSDELYAKDQCAFKIYDSASKRTRSNCATDFREHLEYKSATYVNTFDMNTEIRNLPSFELELIRVKPSSTRSGHSISTPRSSSVSGPYPESVGRFSDFQEESKNEYEYIYNRISATTYDVIPVMTFRNSWLQKLVHQDCGRSLY